MRNASVSQHDATTAVLDNGIVSMFDSDVKLPRDQKVSRLSRVFY